MPASQDHINPATPLGADLIGGGVTMRFWAPAAERVHVAFGGVAGYQPRPEDELVRDPATGHWTGFFPGVGPGAKYRFLVQRAGRTGFKRDPRAYELEFYDYPECDAIVVDHDAYPWHDEQFRTPDFADLIVYQFHIGVFHAVDDEGQDRRPKRVAKLLDAVQRVPYLAELGVTAVQPLPVVEFQGEWSLGYNGTDLFSPEMDYCVTPDDLPPYLEKVNDLLARRGAAALSLADLAGQVNQLKAFIDVCHLYGIAVLIDVVYNHAGGNLGEQSLDDIDLSADHEHNPYFSRHGWAGGKVFAFDRPDVRRYLIDNARLFLDRYHADGLRFDEVSVIDRFGGWSLCQELTEELRRQKPGAVQIAEYWGEHRWLAVQRPPAGMGFDIGYSDGLREAVRRTLAAAAGGAGATVHIGRIGDGLRQAWGTEHGWQSYQCLENHDLVLDADDHREPRIARLADATDPRSWYARSRARVATGVLLTAPGVPMLFMGQEFLEDKLWSDSPDRGDRLIWWDGALGQDRHMADFLRCTRDLIHLRRWLPALRADPIVVWQPTDRVLAYHRWVPGAGRDVVVVVSLAEATYHDGSFRLGMPQPGRWHEVFNSDAYDSFPNPWVSGNNGGVDASGPGLHGFAQSAGLTIPANGILVFARDPA
ncbi:1,4-alpha-glucan branching protein [Actinoplanes sp. ATCC 53533]|uniref:alpha amylase C-terminal domain-containing protein n=1 Tax=Actinoplanes sp. ATCC 53533 TaxID=1288362 RepID=UPI000F793798|nr:alpha amylase C-terminal domain-containing protein [Actinoplanes sp. ATCC 53533]RSM55627.1 1,4-alpha-glucan branching protein [Actinoplanes sp. ATCC 53533]